MGSDTTTTTRTICGRGASQSNSCGMSIIKDNLEGGDSVIITGFGQWKVREKNTRIGRNPKTLEEFEVSPRRVVTFYPSNVWREIISDNSGPN